MAVQTENRSTSLCERVFINSYLQENIIHESLLPSDWRDAFPPYAKGLVDIDISYYKISIYLLLTFKCQKNNQLVQVPIRVVIHPKDAGRKLPECLILNTVFLFHQIKQQYRKADGLEQLSVVGSDRYKAVDPESDPNLLVLLSDQTSVKKLWPRYISSECPTCHHVSQSKDQETDWYDQLKTVH